MKKRLFALLLALALCLALLPAGTMAASGSWKQENGHWWYRNADGTWPVSAWQKIGGDWYYFGSDGYAVTDGWVRDGACWCWMDGNGLAVTGWTQISGTWYYFNTAGHAVTNGWAKDGSHWCWMDGNGVAVTGWKMISGEWYYFDGNGHAVMRDWVQDGGDWYFFNADGVCVPALTNCDSGRYQSDEYDELYIQQISAGGTVVFTASWYRLYAMDSAIGIPQGDRLVFSYDDGYGTTAEGYIVFGRGTAELTLTSSKLPYVHPGTVSYTYMG